MRDISRFPVRSALPIALGLFALGGLAGWWRGPMDGAMPENHRTSSPHQSAASGTEASPDVPVAGQTQSADAFAKLSEALNLNDPLDRTRALSALSHSLDLSEVKELLRRLATHRISELNTVSEQLFARWGELDPVAAILTAVQSPSGADRLRVVCAVVGAWAEKDAHAAEQWIAGVPDAAIRKAAEETLICAVAAKDPQQALALAERLRPSFDSCRTIAEAIFDPWVEKNPQEAAAQAAQLPPRVRMAALERVATQWARTDLPKALAWADAFPDQVFAADAIEGTQSAPLNDVLMSWAKRDSSAALQWIEQLPEGEKKAALVTSSHA